MFRETSAHQPTYLSKNAFLNPMAACLLVSRPQARSGYSILLYLEWAVSNLCIIISSTLQQKEVSCLSRKAWRNLCVVLPGFCDHGPVYMCELTRIKISCECGTRPWVLFVWCLVFLCRSILAPPNKFILLCLLHYSLVTFFWCNSTAL